MNQSFVQIATIITGIIGVVVAYYVGMVLPSKKSSQERKEDYIKLKNSVENLEARLVSLEKEVDEIKRENLKVEIENIRGMIKEISVTVNQNNEWTKALMTDKLKRR